METNKVRDELGTAAHDLGTKLFPHKQGMSTLVAQSTPDEPSRTTIVITATGEYRQALEKALQGLGLKIPFGTN